MPGPFNNPPFPNNIDDFPFMDLDLQKKAEMAGVFSLFSDEKRDSANGNVAPDTIGADTYFTQYFVNEEILRMESASGSQGTTGYRSLICTV